MFTDDKVAGMVGSITEVFPGAAYQSRALLPQRLARAPRTRHQKVAAKLDGMKLKEAAKVVREGYAETLTYTRFPMER